MNTRAFFRAFSLTFILFNTTLPALCQNQAGFSIIELDGNKHAVSATEISPDQKTIAIGTAGGPVYFLDLESKKVVRQIPVEGYPWGPYLNYSSDGKYLLLQQQFFTDFALNKDRPSRAEVLDVASGKILLSRDGVHSAAFSPDNISLITLEYGEIIFWNIARGIAERKFTPENSTNAFAVNAAGDVIAVSQKPAAEDLKNISSIRDDKKAIREAMKFREVVAFYDAKTFSKKLVADDIFDIIFSMHFSADGSSLYLFNAPNTRFRKTNGAARNGYIQSVNPSTGTASRVIFPTGATEPQYKESFDRKYFAATSIEQRFRVLHTVEVFDRETGSTIKHFVNDFRMTEDVHTGRAAFEFLPDNETMIVMYGSRLATLKIQE